MDLDAKLLGITLLLLSVLIGLAVERLKPAQTGGAKSARFNLLYTLAHSVSYALVRPAILVLTLLVVNHLGGGLIELPKTGWGLLIGFGVYAVAMDGMEYAFHRAQHHFPVLWAMHSFHHSDTTLNASSTNRHYWAELGIKTLTIYPVVGILFAGNVAITSMYALLSLYNIFAHMNIRIGFGRWSFLMNSPQYHRIHHSVLPQHYDCNFAALFPVFDVLFGTYRQPQAGEFPPTGLESGEHPTGIIDTVCWPIRSWMPRNRGLEP